MQTFVLVFRGMVFSRSVLKIAHVSEVGRMAASGLAVLRRLARSTTGLLTACTTSRSLFRDSSRANRAPPSPWTRINLGKG